MRFVERAGIVLESGRGPVPNIAEWIAKERIKGSWWGHPTGKQIFLITRKLRDSQKILVCRLVDGKLTFVHRRLWPTLLRLAHRFPKRRLAAVSEIHTQQGKHEIIEVPLAEWVPKGVLKEAHTMDESHAIAMLKESGLSIR
ncbi:MAG: hypothetical protein E6K56_11505 [Ignavibacteria bacterium]|nr:MAG: hypothetical protein E6K56_11505 [Ignavibacteria bacterium]